jgi:uncharacterized protein YfaS (alpha-2-macroglobulin family)
MTPKWLGGKWLVILLVGCVVLLLASYALFIHERDSTPAKRTASPPLLQVSVSTDKDSYQPGEIAIISWRVVNPTEDTIYVSQIHLKVTYFSVKIYEGDAAIDQSIPPNSTYNGLMEFRIPNNALSGTYNVEVSLTAPNGATMGHASFSVRVV